MAIRFGRYETQEALAVGGMAKVYRGVARSEAGFERPIAIKIMHTHIASDPDFVNMFLDEARVASKIHHPNVVATHDIQRSPRGIFLVMDYVDGVDLGLLLRCMRKREKLIDLGVVVRLVIETLKGLQAAHELTTPGGEPLNVVHRDVSPQNILVDRAGFVKITDFGVAHAAERLATTRGGELKGKMGYIAPEHVREGIVDARSDVYAAGVVLWELLTNKRLFKADDRISVLADIMAGRIISPREHVPEIPEALSAVCLKALSLDPADRFQSAAEFARALRLASTQSEFTLAEAEDIAQFIKSSHVLELAAGNREQLNREESTQSDLTIFEIHPPQVPVQKKRTGLQGWAAIAVGAIVGLSGLAYGALQRPESERPIVFEAPVTELQVTAMPTLTDPKQVHVDQEASIPTVADLPAAEPSSKRTRRPASESQEPTMYHPRGL